MTAAQIIIVKQTWKTFRGISPATVGDLFYSKLFADNPSLRKMFPNDMQQQNQKLIDMLNTVVMRVDRLDELTEEIATMAERHITYGVKPAHYKLVCNALLWTLQKGLGGAWNEEVKTAWFACYSIIADSMIKTISLSTKEI